MLTFSKIIGQTSELVFLQNLLNIEIMARNQMCYDNGPQLNYDKILDHIGQLGWFQIKINLLLWMVSTLVGINVVVFAFTGYIPKYRCRIPYCETALNATYLNSNATLSPFVLQGIKEDYRELGCEYIEPADVSGLSKDTSNCDAYLKALNHSSNYRSRSCAREEDLTEEKDDIVFDTSIVKSSVVTSYGLTCKWHYLTQLYGATHVVGVLIGSFLFGYLSDKYGRIFPLLLGITLVSLCQLVGAYMPILKWFGFLRFLAGMAEASCYTSAFVLAIEYSGSKFKTYLSVAFAIPFAIGELILGLEAYFLRDWVTLQIVSLVPWLVIVPIIWVLVPESPRWLLSMERWEDAIKVIKQVAKGNGHEVPEELLCYENEVPEPSSNTVQYRGESRKSSQNTVKHCPFKALFLPLSIGLRTANMFYQWFAVTLVYYGLSFSSTGLAGSPYINFCISVSIEIPGYLLGLFVMDCWGRRPILLFCQIIAGGCCIIAGLMFEVIDQHGSNTSMILFQLFLASTGKMLASATFQIIYVYTVELFPTTTRNTAIGTCSSVARLGQILSYFLKLLRDYYWKPAPMLLMGMASLIAGCLALFFPETVGEPLPQTVEDCIHIGEGNNERGLCTCIWPDGLKNYNKYSGHEMISTKNDD